jgi:hypothetical protein
MVQGSFFSFKNFLQAFIYPAIDKNKVYQCLMVFILKTI